MTPAISKTLAAVDLPATVDTEGACEIIEELEGRGHLGRQSGDGRSATRPPYSGRTRIYEVDDVIAHARKRYEQAPVRVATRSRRPAMVPAKPSLSP